MTTSPDDLTLGINTIVGGTNTAQRAASLLQNGPEAVFFYNVFRRKRLHLHTASGMLLSMQNFANATAMCQMMAMCCYACGRQGCRQTII